MTLDSRINDLATRIGTEILRLRGNSALSARMHPFHVALAGQASAPCNVYWMGDSVSEGAAVGAFTDRAQAVFEQTMRHKSGGDGYRPSWVISPFVQNPATFSMTPVSASNNPSNLGVQYDENIFVGGLAGKSIGLQKNGWIQWTFTGTRVRIWYTRTDFFGLTANVIIDGANVATLDGGGVVDPAVSWTSNVLSAGTHTVRVQEAANNGGSFWIDGAQFLNGDEASGVHVFDGARSGAKALDYANSSTPWPNAMAKISPALVIMMFGFNDSTERTVSQYKADMQAVVARIQAKLTTGTYTLAIITPWAPNPQPSGGWAAYMKAAEEVAEAHPNGVCIRVIDRWSKMVSGQNNPGMFATDTVHPNSGGQRVLGAYVASSLELPAPVR